MKSKFGCVRFKTVSLYMYMHQTFIYNEFLTITVVVLVLLITGTSADDRVNFTGCRIGVASLLLLTSCDWCNQRCYHRCYRLLSTGRGVSTFCKTQTVLLNLRSDGKATGCMIKTYIPNTVINVQEKSWHSCERYGDAYENWPCTGGGLP